MAVAVLWSAVGVSSASPLLSKLIEGVIEEENSLLTASQGGLYSRQSAYSKISPLPSLGYVYCINSFVVGSYSTDQKKVTISIPHCFHSVP